MKAKKSIKPMVYEHFTKSEARDLLNAVLDDWQFFYAHQLSVFHECHMKSGSDSAKYNFILSKLPKQALGIVTLMCIDKKSMEEACRKLHIDQDCWKEATFAAFNKLGEAIIQMREYFEDGAPVQGCPAAV